MKPFKELLEESVTTHGHLCAGQVIGVRMAILGCRLVGINDPKAPHFRKKLIVFVEIDRCATDAIASVTGCQLGKRTLKFKDFGINAATFVNLETNIAYRVISTESSRELAAKYAPAETSQKSQQLVGYQTMPDDLLLISSRSMYRLKMQKCRVHHDTMQSVSTVARKVRDGKEVVVNDKVYCQPCSDRSYFTIIDPYWLPEHQGILKENVLS